MQTQMNLSDLVKRANRNLKIRGRNQRFSITDFDKFKTNQSRNRYLNKLKRTASGQIFKDESITYKNNLIQAIMRRWGYDPAVFIGRRQDGPINRLNVQRLNYLKGLIPPELHATVTIIFSLTQEQIELLERKSAENLIQYQYYIGIQSGEQDETLRSLLNRGDIVDKGFFDQVFRRISGNEFNV